jgi:hypothetical protein
VAWNGTIWVAGGVYGTNRLAYSSDGITWTASTSGNGIFTTKCGALASSIILPLTTTSYVDITALETTLGPASLPTAGFVAGGYIEYGGTNTLAYSPDGITWTPSVSGNSIFRWNVADIATNGTMWVAVGGNYSGTLNTIAYSYDGIRWLPSSNGSSIFSVGGVAVAWGSSKWVAGGSGTNQLAYSTE